MTAQTADQPVTAPASAKARSVAQKQVPGTSKARAPIAKKASAKAAKKVSAKAPAVKKADAKTATNTKVKPVAKTAPAKIKKPKLVRDSFTIPKDEYLALQKLKDRAIALTKPAKKSELLRGGLMALANMADAAFLATLAAVPALKTGRPKGAKTSKA